MKKRITIFAKGNVDVRDTLLFSEVNGVVNWNGLGELMAEQYPDFTVRIKHETLTPFQGLAESVGSIPQELVERNLPLGPYSLSTQFQSEIFSFPASVVVLSVQADVVEQLWRHRTQGYLLFPYEVARWPATSREWFQSEFHPLPPTTVEQSMLFLERIVSRLRAQRPDIHILVFGMSAVIPGERLRCHVGMEDALSTRIRRYTLALVEFSQRMGISIIDTDLVLARAGADHTKDHMIHLKPAGYRLVATEILGTLEELGCFD